MKFSINNFILLFFIIYFKTAYCIKIDTASIGNILLILIIISVNIILFILYYKSEYRYVWGLLAEGFTQGRGTPPLRDCTTQDKPKSSRLSAYAVLPVTHLISHPLPYLSVLFDLQRLFSCYLYMMDKL